jgi:DNA modification methylase
MGDVEVQRGDCCELLGRIPDGAVHAIVTDPPYGTGVPRDGYGRRQIHDGKQHIEGDSDLSALTAMLGHAGRILTRDSWLSLFCSPKRHAEVASLCEAYGFRVLGEVIWDKAAPGLGGGIRYQHETILLCASGRPVGRDSLHSVLRHYHRSMRHPHEKPVALISHLVRYCSCPGDLILDPFVGTGTTLIACLKTGRRGIGIEIDPRYCAIAERRVSEARTPLLDMVGLELDA